MIEFLEILKIMWDQTVFVFIVSFLIIGSSVVIFTMASIYSDLFRAVPHWCFRIFNGGRNSSVRVHRLIIGHKGILDIDRNIVLEIDPGSMVKLDKDGNPDSYFITVLPRNDKIETDNTVSAPVKNNLYGIDINE